MKLIEIWKRLGKQPLKVTQNKDAVVFVNGEEYIISKIRYYNGKFIGFETEQRYKWFSEMIKPEEDRLVVVRDESVIEYNNHQWNEHWWAFATGKEADLRVCFPSNVDVVSWRYQ